MNLSLKKRIAISFIIANLAVLVLSFVVFHFLHNLNTNIESITSKSMRISSLTNEVRLSTLQILETQGVILVSKKPSKSSLSRLRNKLKISKNQLKGLLDEKSQGQKELSELLAYVTSLEIVLKKSSSFHKNIVGLRKSIGDFFEKILNVFTKLQELQDNQSMKRDQQIREIIKDTKKKMMFTLIIGFFATILLGFIVPGKIALPFKKIKDALRELQECNFDVSIFYNQDDEIGEIAREMNKMIHSFKTFEELRMNRISLENRKFDALANMGKKPVLVANADNKIIYMNGSLYNLMRVQSEDVIGKVMDETLVPKSIIECYKMAIKRRSKIENMKVVIPAKPKVDGEEESGLSVEIVEVEVEKEGKEKEIELQEVVFSGYGNVIPIRGKESSLDYYLMVLSTEMFV
ncbi:MAG: HAMP domain-containing protein [Bdellovibrionota bacterium]|nr:HAMP domain-containing protein [Bdellovibrionota bacterium]